MARKYYKKDTVIYKFKHDMLMDSKYVNANEAQRHILWEIFKLTLHKIHKISKHQLETWVYPEKELNNLNTNI